MKYCGISIVVFICIILLSSPRLLLADDQPLAQELNAKIKNTSVSFRALMQIVFDHQQQRDQSGQNGFSVATSRASILGRLDGGFSYKFQYDLAKSPALLDAALTYQPSSAFVITAGFFKAPFSREYLTYAGDIDFVNRSQVVNALAPKRQIGLNVSGRLSKSVVQYNVGIFNGNGLSNGVNDNGAYLYVARVSVFPPLFSSQQDGLEIAVNVARSKDDGVSFGGYPTKFNGNRQLIGTDFRFSYAKIMAAGELMQATLEPQHAATIKPSGFEATIGYRVSHKTQLLARYDSYSASGSAADSNYLILGGNFWPTQLTELQFNYVIPETGGFDSHQLLINFQLAF